MHYNTFTTHNIAFNALLCPEAIIVFLTGNNALMEECIEGTIMHSKYYKVLKALSYPLRVL